MADAGRLPQELRSQPALGKPSDVWAVVIVVGTETASTGLAANQNCRNSSSMARKVPISG